MKILFVCHGNICRSPMAEFVMKDLLAKAGRTDVVVESAALHTDEIGNDIYGGMDGANMRDLRRLARPEDAPKLRKLLDFAGMDRDVADPWYTGDFEATYADVVAGCSALLKEV